MSKELPYFRFYSSEYLEGSITLENVQTQGLFIQICAWYWKKDCQTDLKFISKRLINGKAMLKRCLNNLLDRNIIKVDENEMITIEFLDEQYLYLEGKRNKLVEAGRIGGKAMLKQRLSYKDNNKDNNKDNIEFDLFWNLYDKKVGKKEKVKSKWDKLTIEVQEKILDYIPEYIKSQPDKKFRKNPETFFNNESWSDEIINETSGIDQDTLKEYYSKEYRGADDKTIKESYGKFCKCIFDETKAWDDKPFFLAKIDKPLSYHEFKIMYNTLKFSDSTYADWEFIMNQITEFPQYYKNKKSVNEIFKNAIWGKLKIKVK